MVILFYIVILSQFDLATKGVLSRCKTATTQAGTLVGPLFACLETSLRVTNANGIQIRLDFWRRREAEC